MGCRTAIAKQIIDQGTDDVLAQNDHHLLLRVEAAISVDLAAADHGTWQMVDAGRSGMEVRLRRDISDPARVAYLNPSSAWVGLGGIGRVKAERPVRVQVSVEARSYLSSHAGAATAEAFATLAVTIAAGAAGAADVVRRT